jgi:hypothetical protein
MVHQPAEPSAQESRSTIRIASAKASSAPPSARGSSIA